MPRSDLDAFGRLYVVERGGRLVSFPFGRDPGDDEWTDSLDSACLFSRYSVARASADRHGGRVLALRAEVS